MSVILKCSTKITNSECEIEIDITNEEWLSLSDVEQDELTREYLSEIFEYYVEVN